MVFPFKKRVAAMEGGADIPPTSSHNDAPNATLTGDSSIDSIASSQPLASVKGEIGERIDTQEALRALKDELSNIPHDEKSSFVHVQRVRPELLNDEHYIGFLTVEKFDIGRAAKRLVRHWERREKIFGPDRYALPMTLTGAMKDSINSLKLGFHYLLPVLDERGRAIIFNDISLLPLETDRGGIIGSNEKIRVLWYLIHIAYENPSVRKNGFIVLACGRNMRMGHFDSAHIVGCATAGDRDFPIQEKMIHICHAATTFPFVSKAVKALLSLRQQETFVMHNGSDESVLESLSQYSMPPHCVPTTLGGTHVIDTSAFVKMRLAIEGSMTNHDNKIEESASSSGNLLSVEAGKVVYDTNVNSKMSQNSRIETEATTKPCISLSTPSTTISKPAYHESSSNQKVSQAKKKASESDKTKEKARDKKFPGRLGDPRMHKAVNAKLGDPNMSLVSALLVGGFVFPDLNRHGVELSSVKDIDGVTFRQRRNQLLRRLRFAREKEKKSKCSTHTL